MLSAAGIGSGLDVNGIVSELMVLERRPLEILQSRQRVIEVEISAHGRLKSAISTLQEAAEDLDGTNLSHHVATSSDDAVFTATASAGAASESHSVSVISLAQSHRIASGTFADADTVVGTGTLTLSVGADSFDVTIDGSNNTLAGIRDAINGSTDNSGVSASIINVDGGSRLVLTSEDTGIANSLTVSSDSGLSALTFSEVDAAADAQLEVDGFQVTSASNSVSGVVSGVTFELHAPGDASLSIGPDEDSFAESIQKFADAYNALQDTMGSLGDDSLQGNSLLLNLDSKIRQEFSTQISGLDGDLSYLFEIGLSFDRDGVLSLDTAELSDAITSDFDNVAALFSNSGNGLVTRLNGLLDGYTQADGIIDTRTDGLDSQIESLDDQIDNYEYRLTQIEHRYRDQFTALDITLSQLQTTSSYLAQQLANLPFSQLNSR